MSGYRNGHHQRYCSTPACRRASRIAAQRKWRHKPENRDHFRGPHEVARVQAWRAAHPGYWKQTSPPDLDQQDTPPQQVNSGQSSRNAPARPRPPLQDVCLSENPVFIGLISLVTGTTLQDDIAATVQAIRLIVSSEMTPGPLGMVETKPNADEPLEIASTASAVDLMQQTLTPERFWPSISTCPWVPSVEDSRSRYHGGSRSGDGCPRQKVRVRATSPSAGRY